MLFRVALVVVLLPAAAPARAGEGLLWIEGEDAASRQVHDNAGFNAVDPDELSGGAWLSSFSEPDQDTGSATYHFEIPEAGEYEFWLRANPRGTGLSYRVDGGEWSGVDVGRLRALDREGRNDPGYRARVRQEASVAIDAGWDNRFIAWLYLGALDLSAGEHTIEFLLGSSAGRTGEGADQPEKRFAAIDCLVLAADGFEPNGKYKPGEHPTDLVRFAPGETWAWEPVTDPLSDDALFDLRSLNEETAGQTGYIRLSDDGESFLRGDGEPIRFWGGSDYTQRRANMEELVHHANFLAKRGVNIVRLHGAFQPREEGSKITDVNEEALDQAFKLVAAMKQAGIYTIISPFWGPSAKRLESWDLPESGTDNCAGLLFFDPTMQKGYKAWLRALYGRENPYTGIRLADDPAVAIIQLQNEDSMLFWTMQRVRGQQRENLRKLFGEWLQEKYGSLERAVERWQGYAHEEDDFEAGMPGMFIVWEFTRAAREEKGGAPGREERLADQFEFMTRTMYEFNSRMADYLRVELGCMQLINAGNWRTADPVVMDDAERWSYTANEVIAKNHYYGGQHKGFQVGWRISPGHYFTNPSATRNPRGLPVNIRQVGAHPFIIPESLWVPPIRYQSEGPLMVAAQTSLTGVDTFYWFCTGQIEWQPPGNKWTFSTPMQLGQFPAAALIYRKGYVRGGEPVVVEFRRARDVWHRRSPIIAEGTAWDPNRDLGDMPVESSVQTPVNPLAFLVGPVKVWYGGDPANNQVIDLEPYIDEDAETVRSVTGEIELDYGTGLYTVDTPKAQAAAGFLGEGGPVALTDVEIRCENEYATIAVVPLDDQPIAESSRLLVQVGTVCRPTGWKARPARFEADGRMIDGFRIVEVGTSPWQVENTRATVTVENPSVTEAVLLDVNGMPVRTVPVRVEDGRCTVDLPAETMYLVLRSRS